MVRCGKPKTAEGSPGPPRDPHLSSSTRPNRAGFFFCAPLPAATFPNQAPPLFPVGLALLWEKDIRDRIRTCNPLIRSQMLFH
jgi:hypothetical protein